MTSRCALLLAAALVPTACTNQLDITQGDPGLDQAMGASLVVESRYLAGLTPVETHGATQLYDLDDVAGPDTVDVDGDGTAELCTFAETPAQFRAALVKKLGSLGLLTDKVPATADWPTSTWKVTPQNQRPLNDGSGVPTAYGCTPTTSAMVLDFWHGKLGTETQTPQQMVDRNKDVFGNTSGMSISDTFDDFASFGFSNEVRTGSHEADPKAMLRSLLLKGPVVAMVGLNASTGKLSSAGYSHVVLVTGLSANGASVRFNDPWTGKAQSYTWTTFNASWGRTWAGSKDTRFAIVLVPEMPLGALANARALPRQELLVNTWSTGTMADYAAKESLGVAQTPPLGFSLDGTIGYRYGVPFYVVQVYDRGLVIWDVLQGGELRWAARRSDAPVTDGVANAAYDFLEPRMDAFLNEHVWGPAQFDSQRMVRTVGGVRDSVLVAEAQRRGLGFPQANEQLLVTSVGLYASQLFERGVLVAPYDQLDGSAVLQIRRPDEWR